MGITAEQARDALFEEADQAQPKSGASSRIGPSIPLSAPEADGEVIQDIPFHKRPLIQIAFMGSLVLFFGWIAYNFVNPGELIEPEKEDLSMTEREEEMHESLEAIQDENIELKRRMGTHSQKLDLVPVASAEEATGRRHPNPKRFPQPPPPRPVPIAQATTPRRVVTPVIAPNRNRRLSTAIALSLLRWLSQHRHPLSRTPNPLIRVSIISRLRRNCPRKNPC